MEIAKDSHLTTLTVHRRFTLPNGPSLPTSGTLGSLFVTTDGKVYVWVGNAWSLIGGSGGALREIQVSGGLTSAGTNQFYSNDANPFSVFIAPTGISPGQYGSSTAIPVITFNTKGQAFVATTTPVSTIQIGGQGGAGDVFQIVPTLTTAVLDIDGTLFEQGVNVNENPANYIGLPAIQRFYTGSAYITFDGDDNFPADVEIILTLDVSSDGGATWDIVAAVSNVFPGKLAGRLSVSAPFYVFAPGPGRLRASVTNNAAFAINITDYRLFVSGTA